MESEEPQFSKSHPIYHPIYSALDRLEPQDHPRRLPAVCGPEPVLRAPQLARIALFLAQQLSPNSKVLPLIQQVLPRGDVSKLPPRVPPLVDRTARKDFDDNSTTPAIVLASRALKAAARPRRRGASRIVGEAVQNAILLKRYRDPPGVRTLLQKLDELALLLEIAAAARQDFGDRAARVVFRAGEIRLDVAIVAFSDGDDNYGVLSRVGPLRRKSRPNGLRYLRWSEGPLDDVLSVVPERYFAPAVAALMPQSCSAVA